MNVLVVVGSKHGSTREIAAAIAEQLNRSGHHGTAVDAENPPSDLQPYDAFVIGSAIYVGRWTRDARRFLDDHTALLSAKPVWLFSSGPLGDESGPARPDPHLQELTATIRPHGHAIFAGALERADLSVVERATMRVVHAPYGDYRPWNDIAAWTDEIVQALQDLEVAR